MSDSQNAGNRLRSEEWFNNPAHPDGTVIYIERFLNYGITEHIQKLTRPDRKRMLKEDANLLLGLGRTLTVC